MCSWIVINYAWSPIGVPTHSSTNPGDEILCDLGRRHMKQRYISGIRWVVRENGGQGRDGEREVTWWGEGGVVWVMCRKRRGRPDREPGVRTSESKNRFQSKKKLFLNLEMSPFLRPLGALAFSSSFFFFFLRFCYIKTSWTVKMAMSGGIYQMFTFKAFAKENKMQNSHTLHKIIRRFIFQCVP